VSERYDANDASCIVHVFRKGLLSVVGHDVNLRVTRFTVEIDDTRAIRAELDAASLRVVDEIAPSDAATIEHNCAVDVLEAPRFPTITFASSRVVVDHSASLVESARIDGTLSLHGVSKPLSFVATSDGRTWNAEIKLDQRQFGIRPFVAFLGALTVRADVLVRISLPLTRSGQIV
jgi:polyisoprenoid-binding protein YceI